MDRIEEAILALIGSGEVRSEPLCASALSGDARVANLLRAGLAEVVDDALMVTVEGWRHLDNRENANV